ncbi:hypothetical protein BpHYR1_007116 [Brachionus plicatilis]|uniref:Uncharacterized protein n=1 Tax=Brachionus plicatilis TaxID=10195 RepID=A0A3M7RE30_BRAPC|nr:hypothetical protein BpHYR1_007116 [Brachionus plicatilis]
MVQIGPPFNPDVLDESIFIQVAHANNQRQPKMHFFLVKKCYKNATFLGQKMQKKCKKQDKTYFYFKLPCSNPRKTNCS